MFKEIMLMVASSSDNKPLIQHRGVPLKGIKYDIQMFKEKFKNYTYSYIESSKSKGLLPKQQIVKWLASRFKNVELLYLFYAGHGHLNGDWAIQTSQNPEADRLSLQELGQIWTKNKSKSAHLYVFMDSCHSGCWCDRLADDENLNLNMSVFAACGKYQKSFSISIGGGLFSRCLLNTQQLKQSEIQLLKYHQTPCFINKMKQPAILQANHIKLLHSSITNAHKITDLFSSNQYSRLVKSSLSPQKQKKLSPQRIPTKTENSKILTNSTTLLNQQQRLKQQLIKVSKVPNWPNLQKLKQLNLSECNLVKLPNQIGDLLKLTHLWLYDNKLIELPSNIGNLRYLQKLYLGNNELSKLPESMANLTKLKGLSISRNKLEAFPEYFGKLEEMKQLSIGGNKMLVNIKIVLSMSQLKKLGMSRYQIQNQREMQKFEKLCIQKGIELLWKQ